MYDKAALKAACNTVTPVLYKSYQNETEIIAALLNWLILFKKKKTGCHTERMANFGFHPLPFANTDILKPAALAKGNMSWKPS